MTFPPQDIFSIITVLTTLSPPQLSLLDFDINESSTWGGRVETGNVLGGGAGGSEVIVGSCCFAWVP